MNGFNTQIAGLSVELGRLGEKFKDGHPEVQKVKAQLEQLKKAREGRAPADPGRARGRVRAAAQARVGAARGDRRAEVAGREPEPQGHGARDAAKEADSAKSLYEVLLQKLNETDIAASIRSNNVTIVERASPPQYPVRPQKKRDRGHRPAARAWRAGLGLVLARDYFANTIRDPEEIERYLHLDLLAAVPRYDDADFALATEAYQNLRTALLFAPRRRRRARSCWSPAPRRRRARPRRSSTWRGCSPRRARRRSSLDCDLRRAQLHQRLGAAARARLHRLLRAQGQPRLAGPADAAAEPLRAHRRHAAAQPAGAARAQAARRAVRGRCAREFEWVLIDSPPLASVTDALLLARHADITLLVVQHNKVDKKVDQAQRRRRCARRRRPCSGRC